MEECFKETNSGIYPKKPNLKNKLYKYVHG